MADRNDPPRLLYPPPSEPYKVACQIEREVFTSDDGLPELVYWRGDWHQFTGTHWEPPAAANAADQELAIRGIFYPLLNGADYEETKTTRGESMTVRKPWTPTKAKLTNVLEPLKARANSLVSDGMDAPSFVDGHRLAGRATDYVSVTNGLLCWRRRELVAHTPALFTGYSLPYEYDPHATAPRWESYLADILEHDPKAILMLQEFLGYVLSGRMDLHKGLLLVGPPRGGKSTFLNVVSALVGKSNTISTDLKTMSEQFGLENLVGKQLVVIPEVSGVNPDNNPNLTRFIKSLTGEDDVSVNRKGRPHWNGRLPGRLILASNEFPRFNDPSGAIATRFMAVQLVKSYRDKPDRTLEPDLLAELPGILNWALDGLQRLERNREFTTPDTMAEITREIEELAAPIKQFMNDCLIVTGDPETTEQLGDVTKAWKRWHEEIGTRAANQREMGRQLRAQNSGVKAVQTNTPGKPRERLLLGARLSEYGRQLANGLIF